MRGMPGVGKSALARAISREFGWPVLDKDDIKDVVYGRADASDKLSYDLQFWLARRQLQQGIGIVCDSPMLHPGVNTLATQAAEEAARGSSSSSASSAMQPSIGGALRHAVRCRSSGLDNFAVKTANRPLCTDTVMVTSTPTQAGACSVRGSLRVPY